MTQESRLREAQERIEARRRAEGLETPARRCIEAISASAVGAGGKDAFLRHLLEVARQPPKRPATPSKEAEPVAYTEPMSPEERERRRVEMRRARLRAAGFVHPVGAALIAEAKAPPVVRDNPGNVAAWRAVLKFSRDPTKTVLVLRGTPGIGKDWASAWLLAERGGLVVAAGEVQPNAIWTEKVQRARQAPLVVLRDLGTEAQSPLTTELMTAWLAEMCDRGQPFVITTNLIPDVDAPGLIPIHELPEGKRQGAIAHRSSMTYRARYGDHVHDRLTAAEAMDAPCFGPSLRRREVRR